MFIGSNSTCLLKKMNFKVRERGKKEGEFQQLVAKNYYHEIKEKMKTPVSDTVLRQR